MSTNATATVYSTYTDDPNVLVRIYKHWDGYPDDGFGDQLRDFANSKTLVNGLSSDTRTVSNGMECFAASLVAHFKDGAGDVYLYPLVDDYQHYKQEYNYEIRPDGDKIVVTCIEEPDW